MSNELLPVSAVSAGATTGDARRMILETIAALKTGAMDPTVGMAIAANMKVINDSMFAEIAAAKIAIATQNQGGEFGRVVEMGRKQLG